jgi:MSHA biogenesis protein MshL
VSGAVDVAQAAGATLPLTPTEGVYGISLFNEFTSDPNNRFPFRVLLSMLGKLGDVKVISAPRLTALHNQKALLKVVRDRVYFSVSGGSITPATATSPVIIGASTVTPIVVPEGMTLDMTPLIDDEGNVTLEIHPSFSVIVGEKTQPGGSGSQPEVQRREFDTTVRVVGGQTVILGGLVSERTTRTESGIPYLKDIPFLGALFRNTNDNIQKTEIIMLLTPRIQDATLRTESINEFREAQGEGPLPVTKNPPPASGKGP